MVYADRGAQRGKPWLLVSRRVVGRSPPESHVYARPGLSII